MSVRCAKALRFAHTDDVLFAAEAAEAERDLVVWGLKHVATMLHLHSHPWDSWPGIWSSSPPSQCPSQEQRLPNILTELPTNRTLFFLAQSRAKLQWFWETTWSVIPT